MAVGVKVSTGLFSGGVPLQAPSGTYFVAGLTERGSTTKAVELLSMLDYQKYLGSRVTYGTLYDDLTTFFAEGGSHAYVARVVGDSATLGTVTLNDRAGSPLPTLRIDANSPGVYSSRLSYSVQDGPNSGTFELQILLDGIIVEDYLNLTSVDDAVNKLRTSNYVVLTNLGSTSAGVLALPSLTGSPVTLSAGADDRGSVTDSTRVAALNTLFPSTLGDGAAAIPGVSTTTVQTGLAAHALANNRIALLSAPQGTSVSGLKSLATAVSALSGSEYVGLFAPWVRVTDGSGGTRAISPEGYVAACRNRAHEQDGPWRMPAGEIASAKYLLDLDQSFSDDDIDALDLASVNGIKFVGKSIRLYNWRSTSTDLADYALLKSRDLLNYLSIRGKSALEPIVFLNIDNRGQTLARAREDIVSLMEPIRSAGGVYENYDTDGTTLLDPGYSVNIGPSVNPPDQIARNIISVALAIRPSPTASLIELLISQVGLSSSV